MGRDKENGPKRRVKRCLGHRYVFFIFIFMLMYTNYFLLLYLGMKKVRVGKDNKNGPKRRVKTRRLGHMYVFSILFHVSCILTKFFNYIQVQRRFAATKNGPNDGWMHRLGLCFFFIFKYLEV